MRVTGTGLAGWIAGAMLMHSTMAGAQYYFYNDGNFSSNWIMETGISAGSMNCLTDLGGHKGVGRNGIRDLNWKMARPCFGLYILLAYKEAIALKMEGSFGSIAASDVLLRRTDPSLSGRYGRNLSFKSRIADLQWAVEIHPLFFRQYAQDKAPYCSPYIIAGAGFYWFNPKASLADRWYALHPLRLEGQGFAEYPGHRPYKLGQFNIPAGIGLRYEASSWMNIRIEIIHRILFTDYLDDASTNYIDARLFYRYLSPSAAAIAQRLYSRTGELLSGYIPDASMSRGNPGDNDAFFSIQLKLGFLIRPGR